MRKAFRPDDPRKDRAGREADRGDQRPRTGRRRSSGLAGSRGTRRRLRDGYSSLSYLRRSPGDYPKVDRSFVGDLGRTDEPSEDAVVVDNVVALARGLAVFAGGVEAVEQLPTLRETGRGFAQGYFFGPLPEGAIDESAEVLARRGAGVNLAEGAR